MAAGPAARAAASPDDPAATGAFARALIGELRGDVAAADEDARWARKRARRVLLAAALVLFLTGPLALVVALASSTIRSEEVAAQVAPDVFRQLVAESRAQRIANARGVLTAANGVLADRGLPMVADPGPQANPEQILAAASSAQVLSVLPEDIVQRLRDQLDGRPIVLPSAEATAPDDLDPGTATPPPGSAAPNRPAQPGPGGGQPAAPGNPGGTGGTGPSPPGGNAGPGGGDTPPPPPTRRRLIPQIVPLPIPLIGT